MAQRTSQGVKDGGSALPSGTAQPALPRAEALGRRNPDQRAPSPALAKEDVLYATRPKPPAQLIRATRSRQLGVYQPGGHHGCLRDGLEPVRHQPRSDPLALRGRLGSGFSRSLDATYCGPEIEPTLVSKNLRRSVLLGAR